MGWTHKGVSLYRGSEMYLQFFGSQQARETRKNYHQRYFIHGTYNTRFF